MPADPDALTMHGGDLDAAARSFPLAPLPWLDLSTGINLQAYPVGAIAADEWTRLPGDRALADLLAAAARRYRVPAGAEIVAAPGTGAIIARLPALAGGRDIRLLGPTYGEYARSFRDGEVTAVPALDALAGADVAVVVNPNNPDGRQTSPDDLLRLARRVGMLIVDEAFADALVPEASIVPRLHAGGRTLVLRSFGKFYGLAGLRLGFGIAAPGLAHVLRHGLGPWAVSGPALAVGTRAMLDGGWVEATRARLRTDGARLGYLLAQAGAVAVGATPLFRLVSHPAATNLFRHLAERGILVRPFENRSDWLRSGLPGGEADWRRLAAALDAFR